MRARLADRCGGARSESGQALVLIALLLPALLLVAGLVVDYGSGVVLKRKAQAAADASAMAAIWNLPLGWSSVQSGAAGMLQNNLTPGLDATPAVAPSTVNVAGDSVTVTVTGAQPTSFASIIGIGSMAVSASARATAQSVIGCGSAGCDVAPWGIPDCAVLAGGALDCSQPFRATLGQTVTLKTDSGSSGKFYALAAPIVNGANCMAPSGAGNYSNAIIGKWAPNGLNTCNVRAAGPASTGYSTAGCANVNDPSVPTCVVQVKAGNMVGPTASGLSDRLGCGGGCNSDSLSYITGGCNPQTAFANFCSVVHDSPRLVVVPIVRNLDNTTGYEGCSGGQTCTVKVVDLVYFYVSASYADIQGSTVTGTFFRSTAPPAFGLVGPYNGGIFMRATLSG